MGSGWSLTIYGQLTAGGHRLAEAAEGPKAPTPTLERGGRFLMAGREHASHS